MEPTKPQFQNPFEQFADKDAPAQAPASAPTPAAASPSTTTTTAATTATPTKSSVWPPSLFSSASSSNSNSAVKDLEAREKALSQREQVLSQREQTVSELERNQRESSRKANNWPPFCPLLYSNIRTDIPAMGQMLCRLGFVYFHLHLCALVLNWICVFAKFSLQCLFISFIYILAGFWVAWNLQYRRLYKALINQSDTAVFFFLLNFFFSVGFDVVMAVGVPQTCAVGLWNSLDEYSNKNKAVGTLFFVSFLLWTANGLLGVFIFSNTLRLWKRMGGSVDKVKAHAQKEGAKAALNSYA